MSNDSRPAISYRLRNGGHVALAVAESKTIVVRVDADDTWLCCLQLSFYLSRFPSVVGVKEGDPFASGALNPPIPRVRYTRIRLTNKSHWRSEASGDRRGLVAGPIINYQDLAHGRSLAQHRLNRLCQIGRGIVARDNRG